MNIIVPLEVGNLDGLATLLFAIMFGPSILFIIVGVILRANQKTKAGKTFFILAGVYLLISLGVCGGIMSRS
ncbi:hypothetical protein CLV91_0917 [Maribacter vaceletii]|uniref:Uncharacterized protein n=1 Tax=Maribacter vaceletii TaxID=1206816 RepID=A0A495EFZ4_9FLAO|nr:hypothetical protein [Maribacter vaceletii]RKR14837.1 hypothetical protein CLV91_0917 [Maribacter vaceletii]